MKAIKKINLTHIIKKKKKKTKQELLFVLHQNCRRQLFYGNHDGNIFADAARVHKNRQRKLSGRLINRHIGNMRNRSDYIRYFFKMDVVRSDCYHLPYSDRRTGIYHHIDDAVAIHKKESQPA